MIDRIICNISHWNERSINRYSRNNSIRRLYENVEKIVGKKEEAKTVKNSVYDAKIVNQNSAYPT